MRRLVSRRMLIVLIILSITASGCAYGLLSRESQLYMNSRYTLLIQQVESRSPDLSRAGVQDLYWLSIGYAKTKNYGKLMPCLDELQRRIDAGAQTRRGDYLYFGDIMHLPHLIRAEAFIDLGRYKDAVKEAEKAMSTGWDMDNLSIRTFAYGYMGIACALDGDRARADRTAEALAKTPTMGVLGEEKSTGLARIHLALGEYDKALAAMKRATGDVQLSKLADLIGGASLIGESAFVHAELPRLYMLHKCLLETGRITEAKEGFDRLLALPVTAENNDVYWMLLYDRGRVAEAEKDWEKAVEFYRRAIEVIERLRSTINTEASKIGFVGDKQGVYFGAVSLLFTQDRHEEAFEYAERAKARALVDMLASHRRFAIRSPQVKRAETALARLDQAESGAMIQGEEVDLEPASKRRGLIVRLKEDLQASAPELASLVTVTTASIADIRAGLSADETLVEYYGRGDVLYAFVMDGHGIQGFELNGRGLTGDVSRLREAIADPGSEAYREISRHLYDRLISPMQDSLTTPSLLIVPHGALHYLPFNVLDSGSAYMIDRYGIRILPSSGVIKFLKMRAAQRDGLFVLGNPDLGDPRLDLKFAQQEAVTIGKDLSKAEVLLRENATETALKQRGGLFKYIHLATHGSFFPEAPLDSCLMLAGDGQNDGMLTVGELYGLELDADLVTLSACETALGKVESGDDVVGFTRGFLYAGAGSLVSSLWSVDDRATFELMTRFYENLETMPKRDALREAQKIIRTRYPHPFYWAAFQITGGR